MKIAIILLTYKRTAYALRTINAVETFLTGTDWGWFIADDGSEGSHVSRIVDRINLVGGHSLEDIYSKKSSYGAMANQALQKAWTAGYDITMLLEDDWEMHMLWDASQTISLLKSKQEIGMVRLGYLSSGASALLLDDALGSVWVLDDSETRNRSLYAWAGHPSLVHKRYFEKHGLFPERFQPGETEIKMACQYTNVAPYIVWPASLGTTGPWHHIGTVQSYVWNGGAQLEGT